ncbi:MAG: cell division protein SepF [Microbacteriaceae bacterium]|nr:cell division protein SepF [Microbacteriaceae bacterium]
MANPLRKTMVYLGLADEDYDDVMPEAPAAPVARTEPKRAEVTPLRRPAPSKHSAPAGMSEILTVHPRQYRDVQSIAHTFREGIPVIVNLSQMSPPDAKRLIDFACGLTEGLYGKIERVTSQVFLLSPEHVAVSGEQAEVAPEVDAGFFGQ